MNRYTPHLLTPAITPDVLIRRKAAQPEQEPEAPKKAGGSGGSEPQTPMPSFEDLLREAERYYTPKTIEFNPLDRETMRDMIAEWLRPSYDQAIARRRERTEQYNANLDADAWSRGMGSSTYVTDVKGRNYGDESRDIGTLESSYGSALAQNLLEALQKQDAQKLEVERFNAEQINEARQRALDAATALYNAWLRYGANPVSTKKSGRSGGSGGSGAASEESDPATNKKSANRNESPASPKESLQKRMLRNLESVPAYDKIPKVDPKKVEQAVSRMTEQQRKDLFAGKGRRNAKMLVEIGKSLGRSGLEELKKRTVDHR